MAPAEPIVNAGNTNDQYLSGPSAKTSKSVAIITSNCPVIIIHFGLMTLDRAPVKLIANAIAPMGSLTEL